MVYESSHSRKGGWFISGSGLHKKRFGLGRGAFFIEDHDICKGIVISSKILLSCSYLEKCNFIQDTTMICSYLEKMQFHSRYHSHAVTKRKWNFIQDTTVIQLPRENAISFKILPSCSYLEKMQFHSRYHHHAVT